MSEIIVIDSVKALAANELRLNGELVVMFKQIDELHQRKEGTAGAAFRRHRDRFEEGKHYFAKRRKDLRELAKECFGNSEEGNPLIEVIFLTKRGYLMLAKSLNDDKAWEVQDLLVEHYFEAEKEKTEAPPPPKPPVAEQLRIDHCRLELLEKSLDMLERLGQLNDRDRLQFGDAVRSNALPLLEYKGEANRAITISQRLQDTGHGGLARKRNVLIDIGKRAAVLHRERHGCGPSKHDQFVDGAVRQVCSYMMADVDLIDRAVKEYCLANQKPPF